MRHRSIALLILAGCTLLLGGAGAARRIGWGDHGGAVGLLLAPFLIFVPVNMVVYVFAG